MNTTYPNRVKSPYQAKQRDVFDVSNKNHPAREIINSCIGAYALNVTFEEDKETAQKLNHISGVVAFICTIRKDGQVIGIGRSHNILSSTNKFFERVVSASFGYSFMDAVSKTTRAMEAFHTSHNLPSQSTPVTTKSNHVAKDSYVSEDRISDKQRSYLQELINVNFDGEEREIQLKQLDNLSRSEASNLISDFKK